MKRNKLRIILFTIIAILAQGAYAYAASSSSSTNKQYSQDELDNMTPGWEKDDIDKSTYKVDSYKNSFSDEQTTDSTTKKDSSSSSNSSSSTTNSTVDSNLGNVIVSTSPSTGIQGDFWGKTKDGKWILIKQGSPATGWQSVRGKWYYMDADGVMQTGWINDGTTWYYLNSDGSMAYNTYVDGYYLGEDGAMI